MRRALAMFAAAAVLGRGALAQADRVVAVVPLSTLGSEDASATSKDLARSLEGALATLPGTKVVTAAQVAAAITKAKQPRLRACDGDAVCLAQIGTLTGASVVIAGELGGLGDAQVVYLAAVDTATQRELRSTTLAIGGATAAASPAARGAVVQLLDPDAFVGHLHLAIDAKGATVYVNGNKVGVSPLAAIDLPVGTHAVRVTHPEYRDFVRFVDVTFDQTAELEVPLQQFPIVERDVTAKVKRPSDLVVGEHKPWYRRWWAIAGGAVLLGTTTAIVVGAIVDGTDVDESRPVGQ